MNGVPRLNIQYPSYGNVLARGAAIKGQESRNILTQMQIEGYPEEQNWLRKQRGWAEEDREIAAKQRIITQEATAFSTALRAKTSKAAKQIYNAMKPEGSEDIVDFTMNEKITSVTYSDGTKIEGPISYITEATEQIAKDPTWVTDPEKTRDFAAWAAARGIKFTVASKEKPFKPERLYETEEGWKTRKEAIGKKKPTKKAGEKEYTVQQQIDDARQFYSLKMRSLLDPMGTGVLEGKEAEYDKLMDKLAKDHRAILAGEKPSYLKEGPKQRMPGETIADYLKRTK